MGGVLGHTLQRPCGLGSQCGHSCQDQRALNSQVQSTGLPSESQPAMFAPTAMSTNKVSSKERTTGRSVCSSVA